MKHQKARVDATVRQEEEVAKRLLHVVLNGSKVFTGKINRTRPDVDEKPAANRDQALQRAGVGLGHEGQRSPRWKRTLRSHAGVQEVEMRAWLT